jgi:molybdopterin synthase catalytic subunit
MPSSGSTGFEPNEDPSNLDVARRSGECGHTGDRRRRSIVRVQSSAAHEPSRVGEEGADVCVVLTDAPLAYERAAEWVTRPDCGAVVLFGGTVRDHSEGRPGVSELEYEAYEGQVERRLEEIAAEAKSKWPSVGRVALFHRIGVLAVTDCSVIVAVSAGHRAEAFGAARYCIDTLKRTVPIWKRERWSGGEDWGTDAAPVEEVASPVGDARSTM